MAVIVWIDVEQESKLSTTWVINASFQRMKIIGKKRRINTREDIYTGPDIWQQLTTDVYSKTKVTLFLIKNWKMRYDFYRLQSVKEKWQKIWLQTRNISFIIVV